MFDEATSPTYDRYSKRTLLGVASLAWTMLFRLQVPDEEGRYMAWAQASASALGNPSPSHGDIICHSSSSWSIMIPTEAWRTAGTKHNITLVELHRRPKYLGVERQLTQSHRHPILESTPVRRAHDSSKCSLLTAHASRAPGLTSAAYVATAGVPHGSLNHVEYRSSSETYLYLRSASTPTCP